MANNILKEAIADAKAVREVALANAKAALEEAFTPKLQSMLSAKLSEDLDETEDMEEMNYGMEEADDMEEITGMENEAEDMEENLDEEIDLEEILNELELEEGEEANEEKAKDIEEDVYEAKDEKEESHEEEVEKSFEETVNKNMDTLTDVIQSLAETQKSVDNTLQGIDNRLKALETPTDLPLKPKTSDSEDVGAKVTVPDDYQSNSRQTGLDSDRSNNDGEKSPEGDDSGLKMQEKAEHSFTTETPRPSAAQDVNKNFSEDYSPILKDARSEGYEGLANVARNILKGTYYTPSADEVGQY
jgi:hypothetical protein